MMMMAMWVIAAILWLAILASLVGFIRGEFRQVKAAVDSADILAALPPERRKAIILRGKELIAEEEARRRFKALYGQNF